MNVSLDFRERDAGADAELAVAALDLGELRHIFQRNELVEATVALVHLHHEIGSAADQGRARRGDKPSEQLVEGARAREPFVGHGQKLGRRDVEPAPERILVRRLTQASSHVADGAIARAATQVSADGFRIVSIAIGPVVFSEQAHHEAGSAVAALRAARCHHRALNRMQRIVSSHSLDTHDLVVGGGREQQEAAVHWLILGLPVRVFSDEDDGASTAFAFGAPFLGSGEPAAAQKLQQGDVRREAFCLHSLAVQGEARDHRIHRNGSLDGWEPLAQPQRRTAPQSSLVPPFITR